MKVTDITYEYPKYLGEFRGQEKLAIKASIEETDDPKNCIEKLKELVYEGLGINGALPKSNGISNGASNNIAPKEEAPRNVVCDGKGEKDGKEHATVSSSDAGSAEKPESAAPAPRAQRKRSSKSTHPTASFSVSGSESPDDQGGSAGDKGQNENVESALEYINFDREIPDHRKLLSMELMSIIEPKYGKEANKNAKVKEFVPKIVAECLGKPFANMVANRLTIIPLFKETIKDLYAKYDK